MRGVGSRQEAVGSGPPPVHDTIVLIVVGWGPTVDCLLPTADRWEGVR